MNRKFKYSKAEKRREDLNHKRPQVPAFKFAEEDKTNRRRLIFVEKKLSSHDNDVFLSSLSHDINQ